MSANNANLGSHAGGMSKRDSSLNDGKSMNTESFERADLSDEDSEGEEEDEQSYSAKNYGGRG